MAVTRYNAQQMAQNSETPTVTSIFAAQTIIIQDMLMVDMGARKTYEWELEVTLPDVDYPAIGQKAPSSTNGTAPFEVAPKKLETAIKIAQENVEDDPRDLADIMLEKQISHAKAISNQLTVDFFYGDTSANSEKFNGIFKLCTQTDATELQNLFYTDGAGSAGAVLKESDLQDLVDAVYGGPNALYMSKPMQREVQGLMNDQSQITYGPDEFGKKVYFFSGIPIHTVEKIGKTQVLGFNETVGDDDDCGSIVAVNWDDTEGTAFAVKKVLTLSEILFPSPDNANYRQDMSLRGALILHRPDGAACLRGIKAS